MVRPVRWVGPSLVRSSEFLENRRKLSAVFFTFALSIDNHLWFLERGGEVGAENMPVGPQASVNLLSPSFRADKSTSLINKGQPRGPGNSFTGAQGLLLRLWGQRGRGFQPQLRPCLPRSLCCFCSWAALHCVLPSCPLRVGAGQGGLGRDLESCGGTGGICPDP